MDQDLQFDLSDLTSVMEERNSSVIGGQVDGNGDDEGDDNEDLGSDLDEDEDEDDIDCDHIILCQFDKVTRTKSRWKTTLKDGVMRLNDHDYVFRKGIGEFEW